MAAMASVLAPSVHRVISLLPAAAEALHSAGGIHLLVARGHEDDVPSQITHLPVVTAARISFTTSAEVDAAVVKSVQESGGGSCGAAGGGGIAVEAANLSLCGTTGECTPAKSPATSTAAAGDVGAAVDSCVGVGQGKKSNQEEEEDDKGLYSLNGKLIEELRPTVILTQGLCSVCAVSQSMVMRIARNISPPPTIISMSPMTLEDIINDVVRVGDAVGLKATAEASAASLRSRVEAARKHVPPLGDNAAPVDAAAGSSLQGITTSGMGLNVLFMEWTEPVYVGGHWTPQLISLAGGQHPLNPPLSPGGPAGPSLRRSSEDIIASDPDWIVVCPCGLDIATTKKELKSVVSQTWWQQLRPVKRLTKSSIRSENGVKGPERRIVLVDGHHMFNRSGPRVVDALEFLVGLLHNKPELIPNDFPWEWFNPADYLDASHVAQGNQGVVTCNWA